MQGNRRHSRILPPPRRAERMVWAVGFEHAAVVKAIEDRDAEKAERLARRHIQLAKEARLEMLLQEND